MRPAPFPIILLEGQSRPGFDCGRVALNRYFAEQVGQDVRRGMATCHIAVSPETGDIAGFYTATAAEIAMQDMPAALSRKLPKYATAPAVRLGRLAVDLRYRGKGLGQFLLIHAAGQAARSGIGVYALIVDAKDDTAAAFYRHHGLLSYGSAPGQMFAPLRTLLG